MLYIDQTGEAPIVKISPYEKQKPAGLTETEAIGRTPSGRLCRVAFRKISILRKDLLNCCDHACQTASEDEQRNAGSQAIVFLAKSQTLQKFKELRKVNP